VHPPAPTPAARTHPSRPAARPPAPTPSPPRPGPARAPALVPEVPDTGEIEAHARLLSRLDHLGVADGTARLHDSAYSGVGQHEQPVGEGKERVTGRRRACRTVAGPAHC